MKAILLTSFILFSLNTVAIGIDRNTTVSMIDKMVAKGIISKEEADRAKYKLQAMPDQQWGELKDLGRKIAAQQVKNGNVSLDVDSAAKNIDFDSKQFKDIQKQVKDVMSDN